MSAACHERKDLVQLLLSRGARASLKNNVGTSQLKGTSVKICHTLTVQRVSAEWQNCRLLDK
jgi:hypothetical protein